MTRPDSDNSEPDSGATAGDRSSPARQYHILRLINMDTDTAVYLTEISSSSTRPPRNDTTSAQTPKAIHQSISAILKVGISPLGQRTIEHEATLLATLHHPRIIPILDFGVVHEALFSDDEDMLAQTAMAGSYLVVPSLDGGDLDRRLQIPSPLSVQECLQIGQDVADGLAYLHTQNIIHYDVKPANILLSHAAEETQMSLANGLRAVLCDLGLARQLNTTGTEVVAGLGTPAYMAPEQWRGDTLGPATDIYALGVVLYQMFAGRLPFIGDQISSLANAHLQHPPQSPRVVSPYRVTPDLETILTRCLAKPPAQRYQHASEVGHALRCCTRDLVINASFADATGGAENLYGRLQERIGQVCPQCGRLRPRQWGTCLRCGWPANISFVEDAPPLPETAPLAETSLDARRRQTRPALVFYCPECDYPCRPGAMVCLQCGADINEEQRRFREDPDALATPCWHCGAENPLTTRFCLACGSPLS